MGPVEGCTGLCGPSPAGGRPDRLDGEDALRVRISGYEHPGRGGENALYVLAIHDGRPFLPPVPHVGQFRPRKPARFAVGRDPRLLPVRGAAELRPRIRPPPIETLVFVRAGFQITLPGSWPVRRESGHSVEIIGGGRSLSIWVGDADGRLHKTCGIDDSGPSGPSVLMERRYWERCEDATIHGLDDFAQLFRGPWGDAVSQTSGAGCDAPCPPPITVARPSSLGGESAGTIRINGYRYLFALHHGRPYFLRFGPAIAFQPSAPKASLESAVETFQFLEGSAATSSPVPGPSQPAFQTISWAEAAVEFDVSDSWELRPDSDPFVLSVAGRGGRLTLRIGDTEGRILNCGDASGSPCKAVGVESLEGLTDLVAPEHSASWGPGATKVSTRTISLGGEMANRVIVERGGWVRYYVVAIHDGRPLIMAWTPTGDGGPILRGILDSFRFVD